MKKAGSVSVSASTTVSLGKKTLSKTGPKKRRRRISRRKPGTKPASQYFSMDTQASIVTYQDLTKSENANLEQLQALSGSMGNEEIGKIEQKIAELSTQKEKVYVQEVLPAFDALVENLINVYGFKVMHESKQDLKAECVEFLYGAVHKFDASKGSKAFSYFNVVAKNWLTIRSKQNAKKLKQYISLDFKEAISQTDMETIERYSVIPSYEEVMTAVEMNELLGHIVAELEKKVRTDNERATISAIKIILSRIDDIDLLSKRAVLLYIREITGLSSKQLSIVLSSLKKHYKELRKLEEFEY